MAAIVGPRKRPESRSREESLSMLGNITDRYDGKKSKICICV